MNSKQSLRLQGLWLRARLSLLFFVISCVPLHKVKTFEDQQRVMALIDQGTLDLRENKLEQAKGSFSAALEISPKAAALDGLGCVAFKLGEFDKAEQLFLSAQRQDPAYYNSFANLALLYEQSGRQQQALSLYRLVLSREPQNFRARNNFAAYLFQANQREMAKSELFKALALAKHPTIQGNLEEINNHE